MTSELLSPQDLAKRLKVGVKKLQRWRSSRLGPAYITLGSRIRYDPAVVQRWVESQTMPTTESKP